MENELLTRGRKMNAIIFDRGVNGYGDECCTLCAKGAHINVVEMMTGFDQYPAEGCKITGIKRCDGSCVPKEVEIPQEFASAIKNFLAGVPFHFPDAGITASINIVR